MTSRLRLRRADGAVYLNRWGWERDRIGGVFLHRMDAPDPGVDLHDHPWTFWSLILWGGYEEQRTDARSAPLYARLAELYPNGCRQGVEEQREPFSVRRMGKWECHRVTKLRKRHSWSLIIHGPRSDHRRWGFFLPAGELHTWVDHDDYDALERRELWAERVDPGQPADR